MKPFFKPQRIIFLIVLIVLFVISYMIGSNQSWYAWYQQQVFFPFQHLRSAFLNSVSFSIGDLLYLFLVFWVLFNIYKIVRLLLQKEYKQIKVLLYLNVQAIAFWYLFYFYAWGANYSRPKLWQPTTDTVWNQERLISLNDTLINLLNQQYVTDADIDLQGINSKIFQAYQQQAHSNIPALKVKPSLFGRAVFYLGIQGYYNPFSGEAQYVKVLPKFMWGFVLAHEMAHQMGIAAEGEANFLSYVTCIKSQDKQLQYSAYFNLFMYANRVLAMKDSVLADQKMSLLSEPNLKNLEILKELRKQYKSVFRGASLEIYNWMLQSQGQKEGIKSYADINRLVYLWEHAGQPKIEM